MIKMKRRNSAITTTVFASAVVVLIVIAAIGYGLYATKGTSQVSMTSTTTVTMTAATATVTETASVSGSNVGSNYQTVTALAFSHWTAIGNANLTGTMSQYGSSAALWWYVHGSALNTTAGPYTGSAISSTWTKFFGNGPTYWTVYNYSLAFSSSTSAKVTADVWYVLGNGNSTHTLYLPYELDYSYQSGQWSLTGDWWGLPHDPGVVHGGVVSPAATTSSTNTVTSSTTTTSSSTTNYYSYGY